MTVLYVDRSTQYLWFQVDLYTALVVPGRSIKFRISVNIYGGGHLLWAHYENSRDLCWNSGFADELLLISFCAQSPCSTLYFPSLNRHHQLGRYRLFLIDDLHQRSPNPGLPILTNLAWWNFCHENRHARAQTAHHHRQSWSVVACVHLVAGNLRGSVHPVHWRTCCCNCIRKIWKKLKLA